MPIYAYGEGAWRVHVYAGTDVITGKARPKTKVVRGSYRDAELAEAAMLLAHAGKAGTGARTFREAIAAYLEQKSVTIEGTTEDNYRKHVVYIPDRLLDLPVEKITVELLDRLYAQLARTGAKRTGGPLGAKTIRNVHTVIKGALEQARRWKWITENVADDADVPAAPDRDPSPVPTEKITELIRLAADIHHAFPAYVRASACAGGRRSEMHGLRWSGVNWAKNRLTIKDVIVKVKGQWVVKPYTKTGGKRVVVLDPNTVELLRAVHATALDNALACGIALPADAFVFTSEFDGARPWCPQTTSAWFKRVCGRAGVTDNTRPHDLRHLMCTHLVDEGLPISAVSSRAGHTRASTTLDIYTEGVPASDVLAAEIMGRLLDG